jgi:hypothetical protein
MGLEFVRKIVPRFRKGLDRRRVELGTPDLFTQNPASAPRAYAAIVREGQTLTAGEAVGVRAEGQSVVALRGIDPIATFKNPPSCLKDALSQAHGEASGIVQISHELARVVEITVW